VEVDFWGVVDEAHRRRFPLVQDSSRNLKVLSFSVVLNTDAREQCNPIAIPKPLKGKRVSPGIALHAQQNDEP
jgi:hypothetical protein